METVVQDEQEHWKVDDEEQRVCPVNIVIEEAVQKVEKMDNADSIATPIGCSHGLADS